MQKVFLILVLVLFLAVVEQTTGQKCSLEYCRNPPRDNCACRGCCWGKLNCRDGRCQPRFDFPGAPPIYSCFCYQCPPRAAAPGGNGATPPPSPPA